MEKRVALVTGGTGGIGTAISHAMANANYQVIAAYFKRGRHDLARLWYDKQKKVGFDIDIAYADLSCMEECESLIRMIIERFGKVDVLVNNAGITQDSRLSKMTVEQWAAVMQTNLNSVFNITRSVLPFMLENAMGRIISISSVNAQKGQFGQCNYSASKAALYGFTKSLAQEVAKKGITVNTVSPGYVKTEMLSSLRSDILENIIETIPVGRLGLPEEIARVVTFLSDEQSAFITGTNIDVNGGQYM